MGYSNQFFKTLELDPNSKDEIKAISKKLGIPAKRLHYYNHTNTVPSGTDLQVLEEYMGVSENLLMLKMGRLDHSLKAAMQKNAEQVLAILEEDLTPALKEKIDPELIFETEFGKLFQGDCLQLLQKTESDTVDVVFADPPFNLDKLYPSNMDDGLRTEKYLSWCEDWIAECVRILKPGGSFFLWNLPKWNSALSDFLHGRLNFKHWIAVDIKYGLPISGRLYPSHYSLLYFIKGEKANTFSPDRLPMATCPKCFGDLKDYGGYKSKMNPSGISLTDVWLDIPPVRHAKYKRRKGSNELSVRLLDRVIELSSKEGDLIFDPFGGSGTTYIVSEIKKRRWVGVELGPCDIISDRFSRIEEDRAHIQSIRKSINALFSPKVQKERTSRNLWTSESVKVETDSNNFILEL